MSVLKRLARNAAHEALDSLANTEIQRAELQAMVQYDGFASLDAQAIDELSALPPAAFDKKLEEVRTCYARDRNAIRRRPPPSSDMTEAEMRRAVAIGSKEGISFDQALAKVKASRTG